MALFYIEKYKENVTSDRGSASERNNKICAERSLALPATTTKISSRDSCFAARDNTLCHVVARPSIHNGEISYVRATSFARNRKQPGYCTQCDCVVQGRPNIMRDNS